MNDSEVWSLGGYNLSRYFVVWRAGLLGLPLQCEGKQWVRGTRHGCVTAGEVDICHSGSGVGGRTDLAPGAGSVWLQRALHATAFFQEDPALKELQAQLMADLKVAGQKGDAAKVGGGRAGARI